MLVLRVLTHRPALLATLLGVLWAPPALGGAVPSTPDGGDDAEPVAWWLLDRPADADLSWSLDGPARLTLGGNMRTEYERYDQTDLGATPASGDGYFLRRLLVHTDLRVDDRLRLFAEFGHSAVDAKDAPHAPTDADPAYVHQAYAEVGTDSARLRLGRQEIGLGSGRLFSVRDGPNVRRSFDAARLTARGDGWTLDAFGGAEVRLRPNALDNRPDDAATAWGAYLTLGDDRSGIDLYYLGVNRERAVYADGATGETRHSVGARLWGARGGWDYNIEPVVQFGRAGGGDVRAWTVASDLGLTLGDGPDAPRLGLKANAVSGGRSGGRLETFNALFPNNSYFSEAALFAPANLLDLNPTLTVHPRDDLTVVGMWDFLWRYDTGDAVYAPPGVPALPADATDARFIGHSLSVSGEWRARERLTVFVAWTHFWAGGAVSGAGGRDVDYLLLSLQWTF